MGLAVLIAWAAGAVLMAALGPSPCWLAGEFVGHGGSDLTAAQRWLLWVAQCTLWPAALCWLARRALYDTR
jgi:hypothetical protein